MNQSTASVTGGAAADNEADDQLFLLVGSRAGDDVLVAAGPGRPGYSGLIGLIQTYRLGSGTFEPQQMVSAAVRVGGSLLDQEQGLIHVLHEVSANTEFFPKAMRGGGGDIVTYRIDLAGQLQLVDRNLAFGARPALLSFAAGGRFLLQGNRGAGRDGGGPCTTAEFDADGHLYPRIHVTEHSVVCRRRQEDGTLGEVTGVFTSKSSYAAGFSAVAVDPADKCLIVCCSGDSPLRFVRLDPDHGTLLAVEPSDEEPGEERQISAQTSVAFHPNGRWLYGHRWPESAVSLIDCGAAEFGRMRTFDVDAVPANGTSGSGTKDSGFVRGGIVIDATGDHLYALLGGRDSGAGRIAVFDVNPLTAQLTLVQVLEHPSGTSAGCGADLSPDGRFFAVPCPDSGEILIFDVGPDGRLLLSSRIEQHAAAHARFYRPTGNR